MKMNRAGRVLIEVLVLAVGSQILWGYADPATIGKIVAGFGVFVIVSDSFLRALVLKLKSHPKATAEHREELAELVKAESKLHDEKYHQGLSVDRWRVVIGLGLWLLSAIV